MQNADGGSSVESDGRSDDRRAVVSDLVSLIELVQASLKLIEADAETGCLREGRRLNA
jgi:hypothetical protein